MSTDETTAAIIRSAAREIATELGLKDLDALQLADFSDTRVVDGRAVGVVEALIQFRRKRPGYFGLPEVSAKEMTDAGRYATLLAIKRRDEERQARRLAAPPLPSGTQPKSAKDMDPKEYASTLAAIKRRGN